ncbi:MAG: NACHT domain-containing NTPase [Xenococcaceae cyanobacterium]
MIRQGFDWQRFWCPITGNLNLDYSGFLYDPESEYGNSYNPDLVKFDAISDIPCLILLGEAGIGKTTATKQEYEKVEDCLQPSQDDCLWFCLGKYGSDESLCNDIFKDERFKAWLNGTYKLHLFLDSLDEGILSIKILTRILKREIDKLPCDRLYLRITCRTAEWKDSLTENFREKWGKDNIGIYELCPLRQIDVFDAAKKQGINADKFLEELADKQAVPLAIKPITLKFLLSIYIKNDRFPLSQKELYEQGCLELCKETNQDRLDCNFSVILSDKQRLIVAGRIAAIAIFANKVAIWTSSDYAQMPESDMAVQDLCIGKEEIDGQEFNITPNCIKEVLSISGLFSSRGTHRMGFAHKIYAEFLAAWYLTQHQIPLVQIMSLIVSPEDAAKKLVPQLHETAAWLASLNSEVLEEIIKTAPDVLLYSDVSEDAKLREKIVSNLLKQYEQEKLFYRGFSNHLRYKKLKHPKLAEQLRSYIKENNKSFDARYEAINIAEVCEVKELQDDLVNLALDRTQEINLRANAAAAIVSIGDSNTKLKLKPLAVKELPEDEKDDIKGYALRAVWREHLNIEELFDILTPPKKANFYGGYQGFIKRDIVPKLKQKDIIIALDWLEKQGLRCFGHPFEHLADDILLKAWENFDNPVIVKGFAKVALIQLKENKNITTVLDDTEKERIFYSAINDNKRRKLIEELVLLSENPENTLYLLVFCSSDNIFLEKDFFWSLEKVKAITDREIQEKYIELIKYNFNRQDTKQIEALALATETNQIINEHFARWFQAIELNSPLAEERKEQYSKEIERRNRIQTNRNKPTLTTPPKERVLVCLDGLEAGNLDYWWQLCMEMTLVPNCRRYGSDFEYDLTKLPGWQEAEPETRTRIINGAKKYLLEQTNIKYDWIGTNTFCRSALAGSKALLLLLSLWPSKESPNFLNSLSAEIWRRWTPVIVGSPDNSNRKEPYFDLVKLAYEKAPFEAIATLLILINSKNKDSDYISATREFKKCWDERLMFFVLNQARNSSLKPLCMGNLLEEVLKRNYPSAKDFIKSLITYPLPLIEKERKKSIVAAQVLMRNATSDLWSVFWSTLQQDETFGREVLESMTFHALRSVNFDLTEKQIADFYIWLQENYPHNEDPDYDNAHLVGTRESIGHLRDNVLYRLRDWGTPQACQEIQRIANHFPKLDRLKYVLFDAKKNTRAKTWQPPTPAEIFKLVGDRDRRLVNDGNELLDVLIEVMNELQVKLHAQTPAVIDLWNEIKWTQIRKLAESLVKRLKQFFGLDKTAKINVWSNISWRKINGNAYIPKDEERLSDYIARHLNDSLKNKGIVINREVEIRRGERTDIQVNAVVKDTNGQTYDSVAAIIEVKGCWNSQLNTAMETQLVNRYLQDNTCQHGLYLIGWFNCEQWDSSDYRKNKAPKISVVEAQQEFDLQAEQLSLSGVTVKSFVLNTALK